LRWPASLKSVDRSIDTLNIDYCTRVYQVYWCAWCLLFLRVKYFTNTLVYK
jgi:hypothetical protein